VVDPQHQSAAEIVATIRGARIVVGVEGSHLAHGLFSMAPEGTLLVLQPPYRFNNVHKDYTDCMDLKYAFILGDACEGGFSMSMNNLNKTLDIIS
jgi:capsular polysaccharide biosynthesis protein